MSLEMPPNFSELPREVQDPRDMLDQDEIPEGTFFSSEQSSAEIMAPRDAENYIEFFKSIIEASPYYSEEEKENHISTKTQESVTLKLTDPHWIMLVIRDGQENIIASLEAQVITNRDQERYGYINWTLVHPEHRRKGLATQLKVKFEEELKRMGATGIITSIKDDNIASIEMNRKLGVTRNNSFPPPKSGGAWYTKRF